MAELSNQPVAASIRASEAGPVVALKGEIDASNADQMRAVIEEVIADGSDEITVDMSELTFMDSSGIAVLVHAANRAGKVTLCCPSDMVSRMIEITGLSELFHIVR